MREGSKRTVKKLSNPHIPSHFLQHTPHPLLFANATHLADKGLPAGGQSPHLFHKQLVSPHHPPNSCPPITHTDDWPPTWLTKVSCRRAIPLEASNRISLTRPVSITVVTSSMVMEVSATLVDTTILTVPAAVR